MLECPLLPTVLVSYTRNADKKCHLNLKFKFNFNLNSYITSHLTHHPFIISFHFHYYLHAFIIIINDKHLLTLYQYFISVFYSVFYQY